MSVPEQKLLLEKIFCLNEHKTKCISVGIDPHSNFQTIIKISRVPPGTNNIILSVEEFISLMSNEFDLLQYFFKNVLINNKQGPNYEIQTTFYHGMRHIILKQNKQRIWMDKKCYLELNNASGKIFRYILELRKLNIEETYKNILQQAYGREGELKLNILGLLSNGKLDSLALKAILQLVINHENIIDKSGNKWPKLQKISIS